MSYFVSYFFLAKNKIKILVYQANLTLSWVRSSARVFLSFLSSHLKNTTTNIYFEYIKENVQTHVYMQNFSSHWRFFFHIQVSVILYNLDEILYFFQSQGFDAERKVYFCVRRILSSNNFCLNNKNEEKKKKNSKRK